MKIIAEPPTARTAAAIDTNLAKPPRAALAFFFFFFLSNQNAESPQDAGERKKITIKSECKFTAGRGRAQKNNYQIRMPIHRRTRASAKKTSNQNANSPRGGWWVERGRTQIFATSGDAIHLTKINRIGKKKSAGRRSKILHIDKLREEFI